MFDRLTKIARRPEPFEFYTAAELWTDDHVSEQLIDVHLDPEVDLASRNTEFIERSVDWIARRFQVGPGTRIADFGCGPGLYTTRFAERGADVTGIDFSLRSLAHAEAAAARKALAIDYVHRNYLDFTTDRRFDLITLIFCDFCPLSPAQRALLLGRFRDLLADGGTVLLDVLSPVHFNSVKEIGTWEFEPEGGFWAAAPHHVFQNSFRYETEKLVLDKYTIIEKTRTRTVYNWLQCFDPESLAREFEENGLDVIERYSDVAGTPFSPDLPEFAVVATKT